jgi:hypothetical protein
MERRLARHTDRNLLAVIAPGVCAYLYLLTFVLPAVPVLQRDDQITFVVNAMRMLHGEMIYLDFYQYTPPGTDLIYLGLFKTFGVHAWIASAVVVLLGMAVFFVCYAIAAQVMPRVSACLTAAVFSVFVFGGMANGTHHWCSALLIMCAALSVLARKTPARLAAAGILVALASFFTQTRVLSLLALAVFVAWENHAHRRRRRFALQSQASLLLGFAGAFLLLNAYFLRHAGLQYLLANQVVALGRSAFTFKSYLLGFPSLPPWHLAPRAVGFIMVYLLLPAAYIFSLLRLARKKGQNYSAEDEHILLLSLIGGALFQEVLPAPNWVRLFPISMPAIILGMRGLVGEGNARLLARRTLWAATGIAALLSAVGAQARPHRTLALPAGKVVVYDTALSEKLTELAAKTRPGDFFFQAAWLDLYFPLQLRNGSYFEALSPSSTTTQVKNVIDALERHQVKYVLWSARLDIPSADSTGKDLLQPVRIYLQENYRVVERFAPGDDLWERASDHPELFTPDGTFLLKPLPGNAPSAASNRLHTGGR